MHISPVSCTSYVYVDIALTNVALIYIHVLWSIYM